MAESVVTYCRLCQACCGLVLALEDGKVVSVKGDRDNPASGGFSCPKGRHIGEAHHHRDRLTGSRMRLADGTFVSISSADAITAVAEQLNAIRDEYGPDAIGAFWGTQALMAMPTFPTSLTWWKALGSHKAFSTVTIDQVAKVITGARMGHYLGGPQRFDDADVWLIAGGNPLVSMATFFATGMPSNNPVKRLRDAKERGLKLIVVDPRKTETAHLADLHLQLLPGTDAALFAGLLHVIFRDGLDDPEFWGRYAEGAEKLRAAVAAVTPERAGRACGVPPDQITEAARLFGQGPRGWAGGATGPDMAPRANLTEHLISGLNVVCGRFRREGDPVIDAGILSRAGLPRAEVMPPRRSWAGGWRNRQGYGLVPGRLGGELPSTILPDEILEPGQDRVRALVVIGGNPAAAIPDQDRVVEALRSLELLVTIDPWMSETARLAHYVIAPTMCLERPDHTALIEGAQSVPLAQYTDAVLERPGDVIDDWEFFWDLARHMGLELAIGSSGMDLSGSGDTAAPGVGSLETGRTKPTTVQLLELYAAEGRIALDEVKQHPHGMLVEPPPDVVILPARPAAAGNRLALFPEDVAREFEKMVAEDIDTTPVVSYRLIVRRVKESFNSTGRHIDGLRRSDTNPVFVNPGDMVQLGVRSGDWLRICSDDGEIEAQVSADPTLREGVVAITHSWGGLPGDNHRAPGVGVNTGRLIGPFSPVEAISNMPRLTAVPVRLIPATGDS